MKREHVYPKVLVTIVKTERMNYVLSFINDIQISFKINSFIAIGVSFSKGNTLTLNMYSEQITREILCPCCNGSVHIYDRHEKQLRDMPLDSDCYQTVHVNYHRYRCLKCGHTFSEKIPFQYLGTRITERAARFVKSLLNHGMTIKSVSEITGIHWDTIRKIHLEEMQSSIKKSDMSTRQDGYKPRYLAVDEFAIHKGHKYATCVLDLERGDVIWVGSGRTMADFRRFFEEIDMNYLSEVKAVVMDMNASYNNLVTEYMPSAAIVYDRYHMQAQYGKDVLGSVRLAEAKKHQIHAKEIDDTIVGQTDRNTKKQLRAEAKTERHLYSKVKGARWTLLKKNSSLTEEASEKLKEILNKHEDLAVCYAMKEEMIQIYSIKDSEEASQTMDSMV